MSYTSQSNVLESIINDFTEGKLSDAELRSFSELQDKDESVRLTAQSGIKVRKYLKNLKFMTCRPGFDQRMAAKFALELEREMVEKNKKSSSQPAVSS